MHRLDLGWRLIAVGPTVLFLLIFTVVPIVLMLAMSADNDYVFTRVGALPSQATIEAAPDAPNGVQLPAGFLDWRVIGVANRTDDQLRVIVGNDIAVDAAREGETNPWPEGTMMGHMVWAAGSNGISDASLPDAPPPMVVPGAFQRITLMVRDGEEYAADGGWAYGTWAGVNLDAPAEGFDQGENGCIACHTANVAANDYVFTRPGALPEW
jgi:hypothetical protein